MAYSDSIGFAEPYVIHSCTDSGRNITIKEFVDRCLAFNNFIVNFKLKLLPTMPNFWMPEGQINGGTKELYISKIIIINMQV